MEREPTSMGKKALRWWLDGCRGEFPARWEEVEEETTERRKWRLGGR
jgi:hypothetical protein